MGRRRILTWVAPGGRVHTAVIGGRRHRPLRRTPALMGDIDSFMEAQRQRVVRFLQDSENRFRCDGMTHQQRLTETDITRRA